LLSTTVQKLKGLICNFGYEISVLIQKLHDPNSVLAW
jgi:hypothetical protein